MKRIKKATGVGMTPAANTRQLSSGRIPISPGQMRLWFAHRAGAGASYNVSCAYRIRGPINLRELRAAVRLIIQRHESLRTALVDSGGDLVGVTAPFITADLAVADLRELAQESRTQWIEKALRQESARPFALDGSELFRLVLYRLQADEVVLHLIIHHIICDQWSLEILGKELFTAYRMLCDGHSVPTDTAPTVYLRTHEATEEERLFWTRSLEGLPHYIDLPYDRAPDTAARWKGERHYVSYRDLGEAVRRFAARNDCTVFTVLLAAFAPVYARWIGRADVCLGMRVAGRSTPESAHAIGFFVNLLPLRLRVDEHASIGSWLDSVRATVIDTLEHQETPFETILGWLKCERDPALSSLIPVTMTHQNVPSAMSEIAGLEIEPLKHHNGGVKCELDLSFEGNGNTLELAVEYRSDIFTWTTLSRLIESHRQVLERMIVEEESSAPPLVRGLFGNPSQDDSRLAGPLRPLRIGGFSDALARVVRETPRACAVLEESGATTFAQLDARSRHVARVLIAQHPLARAVALCMRPSAQWLTAALGCLRAGVTFVPVDLSQPHPYISDTLRIADARLLVCDSETILQPWPEGMLAITLSELCAAEIPPDIRLPAIPIDSPLVAYVLFTSGSTGRPKGVPIEHRQLMNCLDSHLQSYPLNDTDVLGQRTSVGFAPAAKELLLGLFAGRPVAMIGADPAAQPGHLARCIDRFAITRLHMVPSQLRQLIAQRRARAEACSSLRTVVVAGEPLLSSLVTEFAEHFPGVRLLNNYGCTELNDICYCDVTPHALTGDCVPVGEPIANLEVHLLDPHMRPVADAAIGEIFIGGPAVGQGYLGAADVTAQRFVPDPFASVPGARLFRTGDFARTLPEGGLAYQGRADQQVKINGCRVDIAHVTAVLLEHESVRQAALRVHSGIEAEPVLVAYVAPELDAGTRASLRRYLAARLPRYMVPGCVISLARFPELVNGKLDRLSLPAPDWQGLRDAHSYVAARTSTEKLLVQIWQDVLQRDRVGVHDNFFDCGGHSVLIIRVLTRLQDATGVELLPKTFFEAPTVAELAERADSILGLMIPPPRLNGGGTQPGREGVI